MLILGHIFCDYCNFILKITHNTQYNYKMKTFKKNVLSFLGKNNLALLCLCNHVCLFTRGYSVSRNNYFKGGREEVKRKA